jgi:SAM-dependent methyltransferase
VNLNVGCGHDFKYDKGWVNLDITKPCNVMGDIRQGLPFRNAAFELVWASHILEHILDLRSLQAELARIVSKEGRLNVIVPYYASPDAWGDPTHCRAFSEESFLPCFWVGFVPVDMQIKKYKKAYLKTEVHWMHVTMVRDSTEYWEVKVALSGNNFSKK